jgi:cell division septum initiation protein DivIVA
MQPVAEIESLIDEIEQIVNEGKTTFTGGPTKRLVEAEEIYGVLDEIKERFPQEFAEARRILKEEQEILEHARMQADAIISDAQQQAMILASDQEVARQAQQQAEQIRDQAQQYERETRYNAEEYADTVLAHLEDNIKSLSNSVSRVRQTLSENSGARNSSSRVDW